VQNYKLAISLRPDLVDAHHRLAVHLHIQVSVLRTPSVVLYNPQLQSRKGCKFLFSWYLIGTLYAIHVKVKVKNTFYSAIKLS